MKNDFASNQENNLDESNLHLLEQFNWGAMLLSPLWCFTYDKNILGVIIATINYQMLRTTGTTLLLLSGISIAISIYVGFIANKHAWKVAGKSFKSVDNLLKAQVKWAYWGVFGQIVIVILRIYFFA